jgi:hypothetical protein
VRGRRLGCAAAALRVGVAQGVQAVLCRLCRPIRAHGSRTSRRAGDARRQTRISKGEAVQPGSKAQSQIPSQELKHGHVWRASGQTATPHRIRMAGMPWNFRPKPRFATCLCGVQFSTLSRNARYCPACREKGRTGQKNPVAPTPANSTPACDGLDRLPEKHDGSA